MTIKIPSKVVPVIDGKKYPKENVISVTPQQEKRVEIMLGHKGRKGKHGIKHYPPVSNSDAGVAETKASGGASPGNTGNTTGSANTKMGNSTQSGAGGPAGTGGASKSADQGTDSKGGGTQNASREAQGNVQGSPSKDNNTGPGGQNDSAPDRNAGTPRDQKTGTPGGEGIAGLKDGLGIGARATTTATKARDDRMPSTSEAMKKTISAAAPKASTITGYKDLTKVASLDTMAPFSTILGKGPLETKVPAKTSAPANGSYFDSLGLTSGQSLAMSQAEKDLASITKSLGTPASQGIVDTNLTTADPDLQGMVNTSVPNGKVTVDPVTGEITQAYNPQIPGAIPKPQANPLRDIAKFTKDPDVDFGEIESEALSRLVSLQSAYDKPINITEGEAWRKSPLSEHVLDPGAAKVKAMDLSVPTADRAAIVDLASALGFGGVGIYNNFPNMVHVDTRKTKMGWGPGGTIKTLSQVKDPALRAAITAHNTRTAAPDNTIAMGTAPAGATTTVANAAPIAPVAQNIPKPQPKPASSVDITKPANVQPNIAAVDQAVKDALRWAAEKAGTVVKTINPFDSAEPTRIAATGVTQQSPPTRIAATGVTQASPPAEPVRQAATGVTQASPPAVVASLPHPQSTPRKADYRVNEDGTITDLRTNTEISQTPPAAPPNTTVVPKQVAALPAAPPAAPVSRPRSPYVAAPAPAPVTRNVVPAQASVVPSLMHPKSTPQRVGGYTPEEIAASERMAQGFNEQALTDVEKVPTRDEVLDARKENLNVLADDPTTLDKAKKIGKGLLTIGNIIANPAVGIPTFVGVQAYKALKSQREKDQYLKENFPATWAAEQGRREAQQSQTASRDEGGGGIFQTRSGVKMSEDDMDLIGSLPDAERDRLVRLSKTNPAVFRAELASIRSAGTSPSIPASTNANQLQQIFQAFV